MGAIVINITDVADGVDDLIVELTEVYIQDRSEELKKNGYNHELIKTENFEYDKEELVDASNDNQTESSESATPILGFSIKFAIIGILLGFCAVAGWNLMIYIFANKLEEDDDIEGLFGLYMYGLIPGKEYGSFLFRLKNLGRRTFNPEETCKIIATNIMMNVEKNKTNKLGIIGCDILKESKDESELLVSILGDYGLDVTLIDNPLYDGSSIKSLDSVDDIVIFEKVGETIRTEIWKEIEMTKNLGLTVGGFVMVGR